MNIFLLDKNYKKSAELHGKLLGNKMILESTQMLSHVTRTQAYNPEKISDIVYQSFKKVGYIKHQCTIWSGKSQLNFKEVLDRAIALVDFYNPDHKCANILGDILLMYFNNNIYFNQIEKTPYVMAFNNKSGLKANVGKILPDHEIIRLYRLYHKTKWYNNGETDHLLTKKCYDHLSLMTEIEVIKYKKPVKELIWNF